MLTPLSHEFHLVRKVVADTLTQRGIQPVLVDQASPAGHVLDGVRVAISRANFIIADLTELNPNVIYEVGFAHALRKRVLLIAQPNRFSVPSDLVGLLVLFYDRSQPAELHQALSAWVDRSFLAVA